MAERDIIKIAVEPDAKRAIDRTCERYGMTQIELASRVYRWFARQDESVQAAILEILPTALAPDIARLVLEQITGPPARKAAKKAGRTVHVMRKPPAR